MERWRKYEMKSKLILLPMIAVTIHAPFPAAAEEDVRRILRKVDAATRGVKAVSYEAEFFGEGGLAGQLPHIRGELKARQRRRSLLYQLLGRGRNQNYSHFFRITGGLTQPNGDTAELFDVASDTKQVVRISTGQKLFTIGHISTAEKLIDPGKPLFMIEYFHPTPFRDELYAKSARHEGVKKVAGIECDVIYVDYRLPGASDARWYFGRDDSYPRRVDRIFNRPNLKGTQVLTISKLNVAPIFDSDDFRPERPSDFKKVDYLLPIGRNAPDWTLKTSTGESISLRDLRGQVVVLDFWATWCEPCKKAMPEVQKLHRQFKDHDVKVFGVNCWDRDGDPIRCMKKMKLDYTLLLDGNAVAEAYNVPAIPTFVVIDREGRIAYAASGIMPARDQKLNELTKAVKQALKR